MSVGISLRSFFWFSNLSSLQFLIHSSYFSICLSHQQTISAGVAVLPNQEPYKSNNSSRLNTTQVASFTGLNTKCGMDKM